MPSSRIVTAALGLLISLWAATAEAQKVLYIEPTSNGFITKEQRQEADRIRRLIIDALKDIDTSQLDQSEPLGIVGDYKVIRNSYRFSLRLITIKDRKILNEIEFAIRAQDVFYPEVWHRQVAPLLDLAHAKTPKPKPTPPPGGTKPPPGGTKPPPGEAKPPPDGTSPEGTPPDGTSPDGTPPVGEDGVPELPPLTTEDGGGELPPITSDGAASGGSESADSGDDGGGGGGGAGLHGYFQNYTALGVRSKFKNRFLIFDERLQLEVGTNVQGVRVEAKTQLVANLLEGRDVGVRFRELYGERDWDTFEIAAGQQIITWGVTDFWPIVDILNPRDLSQFRTWKPIDEKLAAPMLRMTKYLGRATFHVIAMPLLSMGEYQTNPAEPFALPVPQFPGIPIEQQEAKFKLWNAGGGARLDLGVSQWKFSFYALLGRDVSPAIRLEVISNTNQRIRVDNERVGMAAMSMQGSALGFIVRGEAAGYQRIVDVCAHPMDHGLSACQYFRHTPTARANISLERRILPGMDAHLQFISEITADKDIPKLSPLVMAQAPGLPEQYPWNKILTLRLQGMYKDNDFRPTAFAYWSHEDEALFTYVDLEYLFGDGFSLAAGGFWFKSYAKDPNKAQYTLAGSIETSSHVYLRATAWY